MTAVGLVAVVALVLAILASASVLGTDKRGLLQHPGGSGHPGVTTTTIPASFAVGQLTENWTDTAAGATTENYATKAITAGRILTTDVFYPAAASALGAAPETKYGPFPVIVFAPGYDLSPATYQVLIDAWVRAGFVVVAPVFPVDNTQNIKSLGGSQPAFAIGAESDEFNEPNDVAFVVGQLESYAGNPTSNLHGLIDLRRLVLAGQSDGANVIGALVYDDAYRTVYDQMPVHPEAVALLSGAMFGRPGQVPPDVYSSPPNPPAELSTESTGDYCNPQSAAVQLYSKLGGTKWFLVLTGGSHLDPYTGVAPWAAPTEAVTTAFFELEVGWRSSSAAMKTMTTAGNTPNVTQLVSGGSGPVMSSPPPANTPPIRVACGLPN